MARALRARARAASLIAVSRSALRAGRRGRCAPFAPGRGQPLAAIAASRYALGADGMGALRARAPSAGRSRPRAARSAPEALRARAPTCPPSPITCARCLLVVGMSKTSCAARCSRRSVQRGLRVLPRARVGKRGPDIMTRKRAGNACVLPQHVQCESARRATGKGSAFPPGQADPPHFERARAAASAVEAS